MSDKTVNPPSPQLQSPNRVAFFGVDREHRELGSAVVTRMSEVLLSGAMLQGEPVRALEARVSAHVGRASGIAVGSGTDGLFFALVALGVGPGDEVLVPALSFVASASCIVRAGAKPVFVDVEDDGHIDWQDAKTKVSPRTKALVLVHLFGAMLRTEDIEAFRSAYPISIVEDFAQSFGASCGDRQAGSIGDIAVTSFDPTKVLSAPGSGGLVLCDNVDWAQRVRGLRLHGMGSDRQFHELGYNSQLSTLSAALLDLKLDHFEAWREKRALVAQRYRDALSDLPVTMVEPLQEAGMHHVHHKFVLRSAQRDALRKHLDANAIETRIHYPLPLYREPLFAGMVDATMRLASAEQFVSETLSLPIHSHMEDEEIGRVCNAVRTFYTA